MRLGYWIYRWIHEGRGGFGLELWAVEYRIWAEIVSSLGYRDGRRDWRFLSRCFSIVMLMILRSPRVDSYSLR